MLTRSRLRRRRWTALQRQGGGGSDIPDGFAALTTSAGAPITTAAGEPLYVEA